MLFAGEGDFFILGMFEVEDSIMLHVEECIEVMPSVAEGGLDFVESLAPRAVSLYVETLIFVGMIEEGDLLFKPFHQFGDCGGVGLDLLDCSHAGVY